MLLFLFPVIWCCYLAIVATLPPVFIFFIKHMQYNLIEVYLHLPTYTAAFVESIKTTAAVSILGNACFSWPNTHLQ